MTLSRLTALGITISHNSDCVSPPPVTDGETTMSAVVQPCYGPPEILALVETKRPEPDETADAVAYSETGRARGKIIINVR